MWLDQPLDKDNLKGINWVLLLLEYKTNAVYSLRRRTSVLNALRYPELRTAQNPRWRARIWCESEAWRLFCVWNGEEGEEADVAVEWHKCAEVVSYAETEKERPGEAQHRPRSRKIIPGWLGLCPHTATSTISDGCISHTIHASVPSFK